MILMALEDLLEGPAHLHRDIGTKIDELREMRKKYDDAKFEPDLRAYPPIHHRKMGRRGPGQVSGRKAALTALLRSLPRQLSPLPDEARAHPQGTVPRVDQQWWRLAQYDSVLVSSADGTSAAWYRRDPTHFRSLMRRNIRLHIELYRRWDELARTYREAVPSLSAPEAWAKTFADSEARVRRSRGADPRSSTDLDSGGGVQTALPIEPPAGGTANPPEHAQPPHAAEGS
jgi:galactofuranosylgalactofuranosylrhamnosyl-N-acetylglucosaminyl-diphospho-decaprenol beta-1,5/1,6-galactofuranosyltransferase